MRLRDIYDRAQSVPYSPKTAQILLDRVRKTPAADRARSYLVVSYEQYWAKYARKLSPGRKPFRPHEFQLIGLSEPCFKVSFLDPVAASVLTSLQVLGVPVVYPRTAYPTDPVFDTEFP